MPSIRSGSRLFAVYVAVSLLPVAVLGFVLQRTIQQEIDARALSEAVSRASTIGDSVIEPALTGHDLSNGVTPEERARLTKVTQLLQGDAKVLRLRLRAPGGTIEYDAAHPTAAPVADHDDEVVEAAGGHPVKVLTRLNADQVDHSADVGVRAVETYIALHDPSTGKVVGVLETYLPYAPFEAAAAASKRHLISGLVIGLIALWGTLAMVTGSVTRRLRRYSRANDWLARHDPLTHLPNRVAFAERLEQMWGDGDTSIAVLDIAGFKQVNDALGQDNGDRFLRHVALALTQSVPVNCVVARLGPDEFGILWPTTSGLDIKRAIKRSAAHPADLAGISVGVEFDVGIAVSAPGVASPAALIRAGEVALHAAKETKAGVLHYRPELDQFDPDRLALVAELREALTTDQLVLHYQPKVDLATGRVQSAEAVVRWEHPRRGLVMPSEFVPIAESTSLIGPLTAWVIDAAVRQLSVWPDLPMSIAANVSAADLTDDELPMMLSQVLAKYGVAPTRFGVELTETSVVRDPVHAARLLRRLHEIGVNVALDDFGQGATSLVSLARLPFNELKIDRSFVVSAEDSDDHLAVVQSVVDLGHRLGLIVTAEGIEDERTASLLASIGCDLGQGYLYARPMPADVFEHWLLAADHRGVTAKPPFALRPG